MDSPALLMATRRAFREQSEEAEPVLVAQTSSQVILILDDGEELRFDLTELRSAVGPGPTARCYGCGKFVSGGHSGYCADCLHAEDRKVEGHWG